MHIEKMLLIAALSAGFAIPSTAQDDDELALQAAQRHGAPKSWKIVRGIGRVLDLKKLPLVIDEPGLYAIDRDWRIPRAVADANPELIRITADDVTLDLHGFEISVEFTPAPNNRLVVIAGSDAEIRNGGLDACCEGAVAVHGTAAGPWLHHLLITSHDGLRFGPGATISDSRLLLRTAIVLAGGSILERNTLVCSFDCVFLRGDGATITGNSVNPANTSGVTIIGNGNVVADNFMDATSIPQLVVGFDVDGDDNILRDNTILVGDTAETLWRINGTANTLDGNIGAPTEPSTRARIGVEFTADGNYYGNNRVAAEVPFALGGTVQTDWGGNVGY